MTATRLEIVGCKCSLWVAHKLAKIHPVLAVPCWNIAGWFHAGQSRRLAKRMRVRLQMRIEENRRIKLRELLDSE
jgi:hypothetical protein